MLINLWDNVQSSENKTPKQNKSFIIEHNLFCGNSQLTVHYSAYYTATNPIILSVHYLEASIKKKKIQCTKKLSWQQDKHCKNITVKLILISCGYLYNNC